MLKWPSMNPDLNPIENLWTPLKRGIKRQRPTNREELWEYAQEEWAKITPETCENLVRSMPKRLRLVLNNKGHVIPY